MIKIIQTLFISNNILLYQELFNLARVPALFRATTRTIPILGIPNNRQYLIEYISEKYITAISIDGFMLPPQNEMLQRFLKRNCRDRSRKLNVDKSSTIYCSIIKYSMQCFR